MCRIGEGIQFTEIEPRYMKATKGKTTCLGDIKVDFPDYCYIFGETKNSWIGYFLFQHPYFRMLSFSKYDGDIRELDEEEKNRIKYLLEPTVG